MNFNASDEDSDGEELLRSARALLRSSLSITDSSALDTSGASVSNPNSTHSDSPSDSSQAGSDVPNLSQASIITVATVDNTTPSGSPSLSDSVASPSSLADDLDRTRRVLDSIIGDLYRSDESFIMENDAERPQLLNPQGGSRNAHSMRVAAADLREPDEIIDLSNVEYAPTIVRANTVRRPIIYVDLCDSPAEVQTTNGTRRRRSAPIDERAPPPTKSKRMLNMENQETPTASGDTSINDAPDMTCPVCLEKHYRKDPTFTKCGHLFCQKCIREAVRVYHKCPVCNKKLTLNMLTRAYI